MDKTVILFASLIYPTLIQSFSFDPDFPIVYHDPFKNTALRHSYFGFSIVMHPGNATTSWIQIGAPRANSTSINDPEPGLTVKCNIYGKCQRIDVDDGQRYFKYKGGEYKKRIDKSLISLSMGADDDTIVACGPKWIQVTKNVNYEFIMGACYWSSAKSEKYEPLFLMSDEPTLRNRENDQTYYSVYAESGFSLHMVNSQGFFIGAPGFSNWRGTVASVKYSGNSNFSFADVKVVNPVKVYDVPSFSYNGYAVSSGTYFKIYGQQFVSSAVRKQYVGEVYVYNLNPGAHQGVVNKTVVKGKQIGEYFGNSISSGDINNDGFDDLIIGSPFYKANTYNEGRIYVFFGKNGPPFSEPPIGAVINGKSAGGQFGQSVMFLGDIDGDGFSDVAVGAPYEDNLGGVVYIFMGRRDGLEPEAAQRLVGRGVDPNIRGLGYSFAKPVDIDDNQYNDLAVGAYLSGHVVLFRNRKSLKLQQEIKTFNLDQLVSNFRPFIIEVCTWFEGLYPPHEVEVRRSILIDEVFGRGRLADDKYSIINVTLNSEHSFCENFTIISVPTQAHDATSQPFSITLRQTLLENRPPRRVINIHENDTVDPNTDVFNKNWSVFNEYRSTKETTLSLFYTNGCKDENICNSNLEVNGKFLNTQSENVFVLGSSNNIKFLVTVKNTGERAYSTRLTLDLPENVYLRNTNNTCKKLGDRTYSCFVDNLLEEDAEKSLSFNLDMAEINKGTNKDQAEFNVTLITSSNNLNTSSRIFTLFLHQEADLELSGTSQQEFEVNETTSLLHFTKNFKVQKYGVSPLSSLLLQIEVPTGIATHRGNETFLTMYRPDTSKNKQTITCKGNVKFLEESGDVVEDLDDAKFEALRSGKKNTVDETGEEEGVEETQTNPNDIPSEYIRRSIRSVEVFEEDLANQTKQELKAKDGENEKIFHFNCSNPKIICSKIVCSIGPLLGVGEKSSSVVSIRMVFNVDVVYDVLEKQNILSTFGKVRILDPPNFIQNGDRPDEVTSVVKLMLMKKEEISIWILIGAVLAGLVLLALAILGLVKAGFFKRTQKLKLEALKQEEVDNEFENKTLASMDDLNIEEDGK